MWKDGWEINELYRLSTPNPPPERVHGTYSPPGSEASGSAGGRQESVRQRGGCLAGLSTHHSALHHPWPSPEDSSVTKVAEPSRDAEPVVDLRKSSGTQTWDVRKGKRTRIQYQFLIARMWKDAWCVHWQELLRALHHDCTARRVSRIDHQSVHGKMHTEALRYGENIAIQAVLTSRVVSSHWRRLVTRHEAEQFEGIVMVHVQTARIRADEPVISGARSVVVGAKEHQNLRRTTKMRHLRASSRLSGW